MIALALRSLFSTARKKTAWRTKPKKKMVGAVCASKLRRAAHHARPEDRQFNLITSRVGTLNYD